MLAIFLLIIILLLYIGLLIAQHRNKGNVKLTAAAQALQAILWSLIAIDSWADSHTVTRIAYLVIILLSLLAASRNAFLRKK